MHEADASKVVGQLLAADDPPSVGGRPILGSRRGRSPAGARVAAPGRCPCHGFRSLPGPGRGAAVRGPGEWSVARMPAGARALAARIAPGRPAARRRPRPSPAPSISASSGSSSSSPSAGASSAMLRPTRGPRAARAARPVRRSCSARGRRELGARRPRARAGVDRIETILADAHVGRREAGRGDRGGERGRCPLAGPAAARAGDRAPRRRRLQAAHVGPAHRASRPRPGRRPPRAPRCRRDLRRQPAPRRCRRRRGARRRRSRPGGRRPGPGRAGGWRAGSRSRARRRSGR